MVDDNAVANLEITGLLACCDDLAAGLMAGDHIIVSGSACAVVGIVNVLEIAAADAGGFNFQQHLADTGLGYVEHACLHDFIAGQFHSEHFFW